jgi:hypothetical protein
MGPIQRFSLAYDPREDRIAFDGAAADGATARLWLTQRLCRGLVKALLPMLETPAQQALPREHKAAVQSFEQAAALAGFGQTPAVRLAPAAPSGLVSAAHLRARESAIEVVFEFGAGQRVSLPATRAAIRQMLFVLRRLHQAAEWPTEMWPDWIAESAPPPAAGEAVN